jgi:3-hydroxyacyl-CoA dehydrogenase
MRKRRAATRHPRARYFPAADRLCEIGRFGRKTGAGWYRYGEDGRTPMPDPDVHDVIDDLSAAAGVNRRPIHAAEICERAMAAIVNEASMILRDGTAAQPADIDLVMVNGYGFPAAKGGPLFWASRQPRHELLGAIDRMVPHPDSASPGAYDRRGSRSAANDLGGGVCTRHGRAHRPHAVEMYTPLPTMISAPVTVSTSSVSPHST